MNTNRQTPKTKQNKKMEKGQREEIDRKDKTILR
jgi:hypothetical protein